MASAGDERSALAANKVAGKTLFNVIIYTLAGLLSGI
jgi:hypothetical protein